MQTELVLLRQRIKNSCMPLAAVHDLAPGRDRSFQQAELGMRDNQLRVNLLLRSQSGAGWTCAMRAIKAKGARRNFWQADAAVHTGKFLREQNLFPINDGNQYHTISRLQRRLQRIGNALPEIQVNLLWLLRSIFGCDELRPYAIHLIPIR